MSDREQVLREAELLFTEDVLEGLKDWYTYTLQGKWRYVVFTVRRSYVLALIFETITGEKMDTESVEFLTDASLFLHCSELADSYRKYGCFPKILLCDDIMIHGRNINHIIEGLQENLCRLLSDEFEMDEIRYALVKAIEIHVYIRTQDPLLLLGPYMLGLHYARKEKPYFWRQLSSDLSSFILRSDITNDSYIYTEHLSEKQMDDIKDYLISEDGFVRTVYQKIEQYTKLIFFGSATKVKGVLSLRIIKNDFHDGYRVAPFVFLPNMEADETDRLSDIILEKVPSEYREWILVWKRQEGKRSFNEMVTLLLSDVILKGFNKKYHIVLETEDKERELGKLAGNYNQYGWKRTRQMLQALLGEEQVSILSIEDVNELFAMALPEERLVMNLDEREKNDLTENEKYRIRERVEDYFYNRGRIDEEAAFELMQQSYFPTKERSKRRARGCCFVLNELNQGYTKIESIYCMAYFLQMIDAGIGSLSSYAPNHVRVSGYAQFAKAGEQSLLIGPLRVFLYIPTLSRMQFECRRRLRDLTDEIKMFGAWKGWEPSIVEKLTGFVDGLSRMGQTPDDWNGSYIRNVDGKEEDLMKLLNVQSAMYRDYVIYAKEKYSCK